jgi:hypothetical protein
MSEREIREIPLTDEQGFWIGGVFQVLAGWRAIAANRLEIRDRHGWNGQAYNTRADAEAALLAYDRERFGGE